VGRGRTSAGIVGSNPYIQIREGHEWAETKDGLGPTLEKEINNACNRANEKQK
jgi:hypothetical protein